MRASLCFALTAAAYVSVSAALAACGRDVTAPTVLPAAVGSAHSGGTGGGGGGTVSDPYTILPTTAPAPGILMRESFGQASGLRPAGGKGALKQSVTHVTINGFWMEYLGTRDAQWLTPDVGQTWKFCGGDNPNELPSPLQQSFGGCAASDWIDPPTSYPTALMPITIALPSAGYELSMDGYPAPIDGGYVAVGFTNSGALTSNLTTSGLVWLRVTDPTRFGVPLHYELRTGSLATGKLIASGDAGAAGWNHMALRYSPATSAVTLTFADSVVGTYPLSMPAPKYLAFEGIGILDNFVLRQ